MDWFASPRGAGASGSARGKEVRESGSLEVDGGFLVLSPDYFRGDPIFVCLSILLKIKVDCADDGWMGRNIVMRMERLSIPASTSTPGERNTSPSLARTSPNGSPP